MRDDVTGWLWGLAAFLVMFAVVLALMFRVSDAEANLVRLEARQDTLIDSLWVMHKRDSAMQAQISENRYEIEVTRR